MPRKIKRIIINYVAKSEGHTGLEATIINGEVLSARMDVKEGARLIEGILKGRRIEEVPVITARICGVCPVVHNLTAIKALEAALSLKVSKPIIMLRELMDYGQIIQSHTLHIFFLALSDYFGLENSLDLAKVYPQRFRDVIKIRDFANEIIEVIGGRAIHPIASVIGGFIRVPDKKRLKKLLATQPEILKAALRLIDLFKKIKFPKFSRETEFIALKNKKGYAVYDGDITSTKGLSIPASKYAHELKEFQRASEVVNLLKHNHHSYMVGALARLNISASHLNKNARRTLKKLSFVFPDYNIFHNLSAQMIEIVHFIEETEKILKKILQLNIKKYRFNYQVQAGQGVGANEAPRGLLIHSYQIGKNGRVIKANIITPTAQFLFNLEKDLEVFIPGLKKLGVKEKRKKIEMLVRAYDLCISCAVH